MNGSKTWNPQEELAKEDVLWSGGFTSSWIQLGDFEGRAVWKHVGFADMSLGEYAGLAKRRFGDH